MNEIELIALSLAVFVLGITNLVLFWRKKIADKLQEQRIKLLTAENNGLITQNAILQERAKNSEIQKQELEEEKQISSKHKEEISKLNTIIEKDKEEHQEKINLLNSAKEELSNQFKTLASDILEQKGKVFNEQSKEKLEVLLLPFKEQIKEFKQKVEEVYVNETKERASLKKEIDSLYQSTQKINEEAHNLTKVLKGDTQKQGRWGELVLERILESSGLKKGIQYETQRSFRDQSNSLSRPDVIIRLPDNKAVIIDAKVSLTDYDRFCNAANEEEKQISLKKHIASVKKHVLELSNKNYSDLPKIKSLDVVLMFMPIESAFVTAQINDNEFITYAIKQKIIIVTPTTLLSVLRIIENVWRYEYSNKNAEIILNKAEDIYKKLCGFLESMGKLSKALNIAQTANKEAINRLYDGKGNLVTLVEDFTNLGIKVKRELPDKPELNDELEIETPLPQLK